MLDVNVGHSGISQQYYATSNMNDSQETTGVQAVLFALEILEYVATHKEPLGTTTLAEHFGTNKSRIFRHLKTLAKQGYVVQDPESEKYRVGPRMIAFASAVGNGVDVVREAEVVLRKVSNTLGHSAVLGMMDRDGVRVVSMQSGTRLFEISVKPGSLLGYHYSAQGKVALAFDSSDRLKQVLSHGLGKQAPETITSIEKLELELAQIRKQKWAVAPNEALTGMNALAAPVFDARGDLVATIAIVDSVQLLPGKPTELQITTILEAAAAISQKLGFKN